ncbi:hypothetical protein [Brevibacterium sp. UCMA 11752]|uniref:hypothetical protein n=1 Tax=Brevibacterium sp. UCMA 11752 TaxID=2745946 RepID=UPI001F31CFA3|nr:hypothetical protein [Brevibacterium sp. UCMA 11752]MCF2587211.1 hypothetical protein [Brevibacterium sp. UCMA 11752]
MAFEGNDHLIEVRALVDQVQPESVEFHEVSARRFDSGPVGEGGETSIEVQIRKGSEGFGVRLKATAEVAVAEAVVSVAGKYSVSEGADPSSRSIKQFVNEVAVMTVLPYLREGMATITAKVFGTALYIPIIPRGNIAVELDHEGVAKDVAQA